jgi:hypothetical protein
LSVTVVAVSLATSAPQNVQSGVQRGTQPSERDEARRPQAPERLPATPLRVAISPVAPEIFSVAFTDDPGVPSESMGWEDLIEKGGVDIWSSLFEITLANRSTRPITVTDIHAEVIDSGPAPRAAHAYKFTQGDGPLGLFAVRIASADEGSVGRFYEVEDGTPGWRAEPPREPYFETRYISLEPGEIYEASISVEAEPEALIEYRFVFSGATPSSEFATRDSTTRRISGLKDPSGEKYTQYYVDGFLGFMQATTCPDTEVRRWYVVPGGRDIGAECP